MVRKPLCSIGNGRLGLYLIAHYRGLSARVSRAAHRRHPRYRDPPLRAIHMHTQTPQHGGGKQILETPVKTDRQMMSRPDPLAAKARCAHRLRICVALHSRARGRRTL